MRVTVERNSATFIGALIATMLLALVGTELEI